MVFFIYPFAVRFLGCNCRHQTITLVNATTDEQIYNQLPNHSIVSTKIVLLRLLCKFNIEPDKDAFTGTKDELKLSK